MEPPLCKLCGERHWRPPCKGLVPVGPIVRRIMEQAKKAAKVAKKKTKGKIR